jgi:hypothetical protein
MSNDVFKPPKSEVEIGVPNNETKMRRRLVFRFLFSALWFLPILLLVMSVVGFIVGVAANTGATTATEGYAQGYQAGNEFGAKFGHYPIVGGVVVWALLCIFGKLPGTSKYQKSKS